MYSQPPGAPPSDQRNAATRRDGEVIIRRNEPDIFPATQADPLVVVWQRTQIAIIADVALLAGPETNVPPLVCYPVKNHP